jgi:hypothetical protein
MLEIWIFRKCSVKNKGPVHRAHAYSADIFLLHSLELKISSLRFIYRVLLATSQSPVSRIHQGPRNAILQRIGEKLVHLRNPTRDTEVDCSVANLDDQTTEDLGVDLE